MSNQIQIKSNEHAHTRIRLSPNPQLGVCPVSYCDDVCLQSLRPCRFPSSTYVVRRRPIDDQQRRTTSDLSSNGGRTMLTSPKLARLFARLLADGGTRRSVRGRDAACRVQHAHPPGMDRGYVRERNRVVSVCSRDLLATIPHAYTDLRLWDCGGTFLSVVLTSTGSTVAPAQVRRGGRGRPKSRRFRTHRTVCRLARVGPVVRWSHRAQL
jgi:hypothetical protein